ncbi:MAG: putative DNA-binding domain-containing protein [Alphaproteobacteria bacterium]|nr:putative DNA-binding domain-containing protein [Alphaproteobacteria bacterium]
MPTLHELQDAVARSLMARDDGAAASIVADGIDAAARLNVYRNTMIASLTTALRLSYPTVHRLVGAAFFESAAQIFIAAHPPQGACLDDYDPGFVDFLAEFAPAASIPYLAGVARLDWAVSRALHAPDADALDPARLAALDAAEQRHLRFVPHPSMSLVRADHPVDAIWRAVLAQDDAAMAAIDLGAGPVRLLVRRRENGPEVKRLDPAAWCFTALLCAGHPLQDAIDAASGVDVPSLLAAHLINGVFTTFAAGAPGAHRMEIAT